MLESSKKIEYGVWAICGLHVRYDIWKMKDLDSVIIERYGTGSDGKDQSFSVPNQEWEIFVELIQSYIDRGREKE